VAGKEADVPRQTKLTPELIGTICQYVGEGNFRHIAARGAGVPLRTFWNWCKQGKKYPEGIYGTLLQSLQEAEKSAEIAVVRAVMEAAKSDPKCGQWWLERKFPQRWGRNRVEITDLKARMDVVEKRLAEQSGDVPADGAD
jgi:transposase